MYLEYPSSQDPSIKLFAQFFIPDKPAPLRLHMHGWHGSAKVHHADNVEDSASHQDWFMVYPDMRGRGDATGRPDCNGWELQDVIDAAEFAKKQFAGKILDPGRIYLSGGSGGGGNVYALLGKFPDYFHRAHADCGISDYELWYRNDTVGEFRDEMEGDGWIGGNPDSNLEAYRSRGGLTTVRNLCTPLINFHGETDIRVPSEHARRYTAAAQQAGKWPLVTYHELPGVGTNAHWGNISPEQTAFRETTAEAFLKIPSPPVEIPRAGKMVVAGYLKTKYFDVILNSIDHIAELEYDLDKREFKVSRDHKALIVKY